jgi:xylulokinase
MRGIVPGLLAFDHMADGRYVLAIDLGTGGARGLLVQQHTGDVVATANATYSLDCPQPGWSQQDPRQWWQACVHVIKTILQEHAVAEDIACIGLTGQMHGLVLLDANNALLRPAMLWNDQRTQTECEAMHELLGEQRLIELTGKPALTSFTAPKLLWVRTNEPEIYARIRHVLLPKDAMRLHLTGRHAIDVTDASGTSWLDIHTRQWSTEILTALELNPEWLPEVLESSEHAGCISSQAAAETGLLEGTPVVAGAGDQAAAGIGCGINDPSTISVNLGTSGVVFAACDGAPIDPSGAMHTFCHAVTGTCHLMGCMLSAGASLRWYRDTFCNGMHYDALIDEAALVPAGSEGLRFMPYLMGERTPHNDPNLTASFMGITGRHTRAHFSRAVLEGILYGLADGIDLVSRSGTQIDRIRMSGGGARSGVWRAMAADVFGVPVATVKNANGSAYGAAMLAMVGSGRFKSVGDAMRAHVHEVEVAHPTGETIQYQRLHAAWKHGM